MKKVSITEQRIHESGDLGRGIAKDIIHNLERRGIPAQHSINELYRTDARIHPSIIKRNLIIPPYLLMGTPNGRGMEIKVCRTTDIRSPHKNCASPFIKALGMGVSHIKRGTGFYFVFVDLVENATGIEHIEYIKDLEGFGIHVRVLTKMPTQPDRLDLTDWFIS